MNYRKSNLLLAVFMAITLVMPVFAGNFISTPQMVVTPNHSPATTDPNIQTIEVAGSMVDAWGGVYDIVGAVQNASYYDYSHTDAIESAIDSQLASEEGYVSRITFNLGGTTPFPNGAMGAAMAVLQLTVTPVVIVPELDDQYYENVSSTEAIDIAEDIVILYESAFSIDLQRLEIMKTIVDTEYTGSEWVNYYGYELTYVTILSPDGGVTALNTMRSRLATLGGFMDVIGASEWTDLLTATTEVIFPAIYRPSQYTPGSLVSLLGYVGYPYYRPHASHPSYECEMNLVVGAQASQNVPGQVEAVSGDEEYSLLDHVGFTENLQNKMYQDDTAESISVLVGAAPAHLTFNGLPAGWTTIDESFEIPTEITLPGKTLPENSTLAEVIQAVLTYMPTQLALEAHDSIGSIDSKMFDSIIEQLWNSVVPMPDLRQTILNLDFSELPETALVELNMDLIAQIMNQAGLNSDALISRIDDSLYSENPYAAIVKAFIDYFDAYNLLNILDNDYYADPVALEGYLNTFIDGVESFLSDFAAVDLPSEFQSKEAIATFVEEHWELTLGALWTAMANDDIPAIKAAVQDMLNATNLQEHITPYLMADLGTSLMAGIGFAGAINVDMFTSPTPVFEDINTDTFSMTFDADPSAVNFDGPYLVVTKSPTTREVPVGGTLDYTITVHNYGDATAYDVKVLDGMSSGLDGDRDFYWTRDSLTAGSTWEITFTVPASDAGLYTDIPAICVYFNTTLDSFDASTPESWDGTARYAMSAPGYQVLVTGGFWPESILGIPTLYVAAGVGGVAVIGVAILLVRRRP
ncbi:MAG: conserved exported protein of unknown function [Candidatus Thorarchaeota archaeon]|nr:MAG: conserved exported protein of unknown function [Candidatus Thorarchaeota archaeon]